MDKFSLFSLFVITSCVLLFVGNYLTDNFLVSSRIKNLVYRPRIFCLIITSAANLNTRARSVHESWAPNCDNYKLVMVVPEVVLNQSKLILTNATLLSGFEMTFDQMPLLQPPNYTLDRYNRLTDKIYSTLKYLYLNHNDYDWYLKADDDTFVFVENLRNFLSRKNKTSPVTYGYDFNCYVDKGYHSGGAGYVLSNEALKRIGNRLNKNYTSCANSGIEDTDLASCLRKENVFPDKSVDEKGRERFHAIHLASHFYGDFSDWFLSCSANKMLNGSNCCSENETISFHNMIPEDLIKLNSILHQNPNAKIIDIINKYLQN